MRRRLAPLARTRGAALALLAALGACGGSDQEGPTEAAEPRSQIIFVYDRSTSITSQELAMYETLTAQNLDYLGHQDRVAAIELLQLSLSEAPERWAELVPSREFADRQLQSDSVSLVRFRRDARDYLKRFTVTDAREGYLGTDILSTLFDVGEETRAYPTLRSTVILFSDMLQATDDINMEGMFRMPPTGWIETRKSQGRLPDLSGACIVVAGARTDTAEGQRVKTFWQEYFTATGATLLDRNYSYRPVRIPKDPCG